MGDRYLRQFISLRDVSKLAGLASAEERAGLLFSEPDLAVLNPAEKAELMQFIRNFTRSLGGIIGEEVHDPETGESLPLLKDEAEVALSIASPEVSAIVEAAFGRKVHHALAPGKGEMISQALVATAVSAFEVLVGSVAKEIYKVNKAALEKSEHEFTLEELAEYDSIEEARTELVNRRVDALLLKSVDDWSRWFERTLQLSLPLLTLDWAETREIFARRNVIVHNAGEVSRRYLRIASEAGTLIPPDIQVGNELVTDMDYS